MLLELRNYLSEERGYMVSNFPVEIYGIRFGIGFENHEGENVFVRVIPELFFLEDVNPAVRAIKFAIIEMNILVKKSENKHHFCIALEDNEINRHIVMQYKNDVEPNVEVYFVGAAGVTEFNELLVKDCDCEDGFQQI